MAQDPYSKPNESWISLSGTVASSDADSFVLDYGEGLVTVEMDDWDFYGDAYGLIEGDRVIVSGRVDDDFFETTTIEASTVYLKDLNTFFYASAADEEDVAALVVPVDTYFEVTGTVTSKSGREFTVDTGARKLTVDTIAMAYNPLDDEGFQQIDIGDRVKVLGDMDYDIFEKRELMADTIITLTQDAGKASSETSDD